ncbi:ABC transporter permease [Geomicrobium sp. JCM 19055]|uniref:ABC transporter permease n=1 Tax=Geomicrobium sp. JCM 19055 TaxID=1460649 RepID=UPI00045ED416|nr:ABC transporter permease [Geomicrobium sp. JCM 19055]GAJ98275.1 spermidine putrescine ABC transporter permease component PotC [Geomicrobium sp. JCM 19055]
MRKKTIIILGIFSVMVFLFFYIPLFVVMAFSFNDSSVGTVWTGFTTQWYESLFSNRQILSAVQNSLYIAVVTTIISTILGTLAAIALYRYNFPGKRFLNVIFYIPVAMPEIVVGISLLALYAMVGMTLGLNTVFPGHVVMATSFVMLVVMARLHGFDPAMEEAAKDLGANKWQTFWRVTFPLIFPGVLAASLLAFTISLDEFVVAFFTTGPGSNTLPVLIYSMVRRGVSPEINALSTIMLIFIVIVVLIVGRVLIQIQSRGGDRS